MKFGLPTLVECNSLSECAALANSIGLDFVEINMSFPQYQVKSLDIEEVKKIAEEYSVFYTIHADEGLNPFDFNTDVSACYFGIMREYIRFAKEVGIKVINMHLLKGVYVTLPGEVILLNDVYRDAYLNRVLEFISMCEDEIGDSDIRILIENVDSNAFTDSQLAALDMFMRSDAFALTLDTGHDACLLGVDRHVFDKYRNRLAHIHLHDSDGKSAHLPLGSGKVDTGAALSLLTAGNTCLVEVKTIAGLHTSVDYLKANNYLH